MQPIASMTRPGTEFLGLPSTSKSQHEMALCGNEGHARARNNPRIQYPLTHCLWDHSLLRGACRPVLPMAGVTVVAGSEGWSGH